MEIKDLSYLTTVSDKDLIVGGASATINAYALAEGKDTLSLADTELELRKLNNGKLKLKGEAEALAVGQYPIAETNYEIDGFRKVKVKIRYRGGENFAYENLRIIAMS